MRLRQMRAKLTAFFFEPVSPYPLAVFRILLGLCVLATFLLLREDWSAWFGVHGWISLDTIKRAQSGFRINAFDFIPWEDRWINALFWIFVGASASLIVGLWTRASSIISFVALNSLQQRMPIILHGGDTFLRAASFFLMFSEAGAVLSIDALLKRRRRHCADENRLQITAWPQRLIQYQLAIVYFASFLWKAKGRPWLDGTAVYYVFNLREIQRFHVPGFFRNATMMHFETWFAMLFELAFPLLIWFKRFRPALLIAGLLFHLSLEYALNVPMFEWDILSAYVLFVDPKTIESVCGSIRRLVRWASPYPARAQSSSA